MEAKTFGIDPGCLSPREQLKVMECGPIFLFMQIKRLERLADDRKITEQLRITDLECAICFCERQTERFGVNDFIVITAEQRPKRTPLFTSWYAFYEAWWKSLDNFQQFTIEQSYCSGQADEDIVNYYGPVGNWLQAVPSDKSKH